MDSVPTINNNSHPGTSNVQEEGAPAAPTVVVTMEELAQLANSHPTSRSPGRWTSPRRATTGRRDSLQVVVLDSSSQKSVILPTGTAQAHPHSNGHRAPAGNKRQLAAVVVLLLVLAFLLGVLREQAAHQQEEDNREDVAHMNHHRNTHRTHPHKRHPVDAVEEEELDTPQEDQPPQRKRGMEKVNKRVAQLEAQLLKMGERLGALTASQQQHNQHESTGIDTPVKEQEVDAKKTEGDVPAKEGDSPTDLPVQPQQQQVAEQHPHGAGRRGLRASLILERRRKVEKDKAQVSAVIIAMRNQNSRGAKRIV